ncbi:conserved hypothetical protein [Theileria orientalis strain Shintoku]|uniref:Uncharacterized protein n=1 Tax=Theileria orientalis strain Shintoku TaxID=869250 RepID=J4CDM6_THEOR|nr:conserved hypothetical protein [Theileria orientalis strain Shintoku]BAM41407.1 conserved hypothetical protein [Theileria orientalis strain Shintoku]|eukprot:XP_009691708.1 conserved hypothetical protein [Theileria orientalis strain Shintoku]
MPKTTNQIHFIYINMRIPIVLITNILWLVGIINSKSTPEKIAGNQAEKGQNVDQYITIDISSNSEVNSFYFLNSQINGVNTVIFFPNTQKKVQQIRDGNTLLWNMEPNEQFIIGFISKMTGSQDHIISLMVNTPSEIKKWYYQYTNGAYSIVNIFRYLDLFNLFKSKVDRSPFTLDLAKDEIPEVMDKGALLGRNKASLFIPTAGYKANKIVFGGLNVYDGSHIQMEVPIAIAYEIQGMSYLDLMLVKEGQNTGHIHSYQFISDGDTRLMATSGPVSIFDIFVARVSPNDINQPISHPRVREIRRQNLYYHDIRQINLDLKNVDLSMIHTEEFKVLNIRTIKYMPMGVMITSVSYGRKLLWRSSEDEVRCTNVITHSVSGIMQSIEITILDNTATTSVKIIPFQTIADDESETVEGSVDVPNLAIRDGRWVYDESVATGQGTDPLNTHLFTPPNSPEATLSTPPNSPARTNPNTPAGTPPPSPMASPRNSFCSEHGSLENCEHLHHKFYNDVDYPPEHASTNAHDGVFDDFTIEDNSFDPIHPPQGFRDNEHGLHGYYEDIDPEDYIDSRFDDHSIPGSGDDMTLDISSDESRSKMYVIDGRKYAPFMFLTPHLNQKIQTVVDGSQMIWDGSMLDQMLKYVTLYMDKEDVKGMYLMIFQEMAILNKYYFKKAGKWIEISSEEYTNSTMYKEETRSDKEDQKKKSDDKDDSKERELHVSIMVPVILGSLFLIVSVCSLIFMLFFC